MSGATSLAFAHVDGAGRIVEGNAGFAGLFGNPREALRGRSLVTLVDTADQSALVSALAAVLVGGSPLRMRVAFRRDDGTRFVGTLDATSVAGGGASLTIATVDNAAETPPAATAATSGWPAGPVPRSPSGLRPLPWGLYEVVFHDDERCEFVGLCPRAAAIYELDLETLRAHPERFWNAIAPDDMVVMKRAVQHAVRTGELMKTEFRYTGASGRTRWIRCAALPEPPVPGQPRVWAGYVVDITADERG
jgi:PAS domain S-box-containing protein